MKCQIIVIYAVNNIPPAMANNFKSRLCPLCFFFLPRNSVRSTVLDFCVLITHFHRLNRRRHAFAKAILRGWANQHLLFKTTIGLKYPLWKSSQIIAFATGACGSNQLNCILVWLRRHRNGEEKKATTNSWGWELWKLSNAKFSKFNFVPSLRTRVKLIIIKLIRHFQTQRVN